MEGMGKMEGKEKVTSESRWTETEYFEKVMWCDERQGFGGYERLRGFKGCNGSASEMIGKYR